MNIYIQNKNVFIYNDGWNSFKEKDNKLNY